jgi:flavin reductase (DIM6/NTAB) family NADH-FMN oxidoreductase RutF
MTVEPDQFRDVMGTFVTGVTVVTFPSEPLHGLTVNALSSLSLEPPLVLICIDHGTNTYELLEDGDIDSYCVNILGQDQRRLGEYFAGMTELDKSPFESEQTRTKETGTPVFRDALGYLNCSIESAYPEGDHTVYVGRVETAEVQRPDAAPLTFYQGNWGTIQVDE